MIKTLSRTQSLGAAAAVVMVFAVAGGIATRPASIPEEPQTATVVQPEMETRTTPEVPMEQQFIEVVDSCGPHFEGACVNLRSGAGSTSPATAKLRNGVVLKVGGMVEAEGMQWYKVVFDEWLRYPERASGEHYVAAQFVRPFLDKGALEYIPGETQAPSHKRIVVDRSEQKLYAYENGEVFMEESVSTGLDLTPTPRGQFTIFRKTPSRYMQGPIAEISDDYYDLLGVPWNLYFTEQGGAIHGAYWHNSFGQQWSHGCVNLPLDKARELYLWADVGTSVLVRD